MKLTGLNIIDFTDVPTDIIKLTIKYIVSCNTNNPNSTIKYHSYTSFSEYLDTLLDNNFIIFDVKMLTYFNNSDYITNISILFDWYTKNNKTFLLTITNFYINHLSILLPLTKKTSYKMYHVRPRMSDPDLMISLNPKYDSLDLIEMFENIKTTLMIKNIKRLAEINNFFH
jgi:hypothetical protein